MRQFWVVGGEHTDTSFAEPVGELERVGPFKSYREAESAWAKRAWATVDHPTTRYWIEAEGEGPPSAGELATAALALLRAHEEGASDAQPADHLRALLESWYDVDFPRRADGTTDWDGLAERIGWETGGAT